LFKHTSPTIIIWLEKVFATNPENGEVHPDRPKALYLLKEAMKKDLGF
jgi:hypothetical protein